MLLNIVLPLLSLSLILLVTGEKLILLITAVTIPHVFGVDVIRREEVKLLINSFITEVPII